VSETTAEAPPARPSPASGGGSKFGLFTEKIGPLPMWAWVAIIAVVLIGWRVWKSRQAGSASTASSASSDTTAADTVPQFVNQTYVSATPPVQGTPGPAGPPGAPAPAPKPAQLTRTWDSLGGSTYAQVAQRLLGNTDVASLHPADAATQKWVSQVYAKNHNAKMPKGLKFTYTEGTVTAKK
jgi:hypothetical protein